MSTSLTKGSKKKKKHRHRSPVPPNFPLPNRYFIYHYIHYITYYILHINSGEKCENWLNIAKRELKVKNNIVNFMFMFSLFLCDDS